MSVEIHQAVAANQRASEERDDGGCGPGLRHVAGDQANGTWRKQAVEKVTRKSNGVSNDLESLAISSRLAEGRIVIAIRAE